jgi:hypothetical protein
MVNFPQASTHAEAIALGFPSLASYRHSLRMAVEQQKRDEKARRWAERQSALMQQLQNGAAGAVSSCYTNAAQVTPEARRAANLERGVWREEDLGDRMEPLPPEADEQ